MAVVRTRALVVETADRPSSTSSYPDDEEGKKQEIRITLYPSSHAPVNHAGVLFSNDGQTHVHTCREVLGWTKSYAVGLISACASDSRETVVLLVAFGSEISAPRLASKGKRIKDNEPTSTRNVV